MSDYKFSVSMCVYGGDKAEYFEQALQSVCNQTLKPDEIVLVVDGPVSEEINKVIELYETKASMNVIRLPKNVGHGNARREGFKNCKNDYIAIADADDINDSKRFEKQIEKFKEDESLSAVSSSCYHFVGDPANIINEEKVPVTHEDIVRFMKKRCPICQPSVMLKKSEVEKAGGYLDWYHAEDYYLWVRMFLNGSRFANIEESLVNMRCNVSQTKRRGGYKYYKSMEKLFRYMNKEGIISWREYAVNSFSRLVMQVLMPAKLRAIIRKKFL